MTEKNNNFKVAFLIAFVHCIIGNVIGMSLIDNSFLETIFLPYTFIVGLSQFAGWDWFSVILQIFSLLLMTLIFYLLALILIRKKS
jgi:uncharacterized membrane protein